jgi:di/tripeptidase
MIKTRMVLMKGVRTHHDFETEIVKPRIGELISIGNDYYEVRFIQYVFDDEKQFKHLLITAII